MYYFYLYKRLCEGGCCQLHFTGEETKVQREFELLAQGHTTSTLATPVGLSQRDSEGIIKERS